MLFWLKYSFYMVVLPLWKAESNGDDSGRRWSGVFAAGVEMGHERCSACIVGLFCVNAVHFFHPIWHQHWRHLVRSHQVFGHLTRSVAELATDGTSHRRPCA